ncbi:hypothetical protein SAPIO_CDS3282 [Scedosporium apiospermum]|uniref:Tubulin-specific chaperone A n=1 Tax=Pseudallescheria apiosperma TaxID=563466 RepID=A0A084GAF4_PSEDA|nr:uncharacterized protein SAPIO_CDS3282 [Scedosporium apiospermum]KEZ44316.1 hypothetical protein SAPIO_CDS3282 [Scedosporium apiospermum]
MDRTATENAYWDRINPVRRTPSKLHIATQALFRLIKEEKSYHKELQHQKQRVERLKAELAKGINVDVNSEYMIRQEERAIAQTEAVFAPLHKKIEDGIKSVQEELAYAEDPTPIDELENARQALLQARDVLGLPPINQDDY